MAFPRARATRVSPRSQRPANRSRRCGAAGIGILNIAVDDFRSEDIFGRSNVVKFVDLGRLVS